MQALDTTFADRLFAYTQIERQGTIAIYRQTHLASGIDRYEVVKIRVAPAHTWPNGGTSPERETYPGASSWGKMGCTFLGLEAARAWAKTLQRQEAHDPEDAARISEAPDANERHSVETTPTKGHAHG